MKNDRKFMDRNQSTEASKSTVDVATV